MKEKLQKFISNVGNVATAAAILEISKETLKKYISGKDIPRSIIEKKISPIIGVPMQELLKLLVERIKELDKYQVQLLEDYKELRLIEHKYELSVKQHSQTMEAVVRSPITYYIKDHDWYDHLDPFANLERAIEAMVAKENNANLMLYHALEEYAKVYELFRPYQVTHDSPYWGTISIIEGIYKTIYISLGITPISFSKGFQSTLDQYFPPPVVKFDDIDWESITRDLRKITLAIKQMINKEAVRLFAVLGKETPHEVISYIKEYIKTELNDISDNEIQIYDATYPIIIIRGERIEVKSEHQLRYTLLEMKNKVKGS